MTNRKLLHAFIFDALRSLSLIYQFDLAPDLLRSVATVRGIDGNRRLLTVWILRKPHCVVPFIRLILPKPLRRLVVH